MDKYSRVGKMPALYEPHQTLRTQSEEGLGEFLRQSHLICLLEAEPPKIRSQAEPGNEMTGNTARNHDFSW